MARNSLNPNNIGFVLGNALGNVGRGAWYGNITNKAKKLVNKGMSQLDALMNPEPIRDAGVNTSGNTGETETIKIGDQNVTVPKKSIDNLGINPPQERKPDYKSALDKLFKVTNELRDPFYEDVGQQYAKSLEDYYSANLPKKNSKKYRFFSVYNSVYRVDEDGNIELVAKDQSDDKKKNEKKKYSGNELFNMSLEDAMQLDPGLIEDYLGFFSPEVQDALKQKFPWLVQTNNKKLGIGNNRKTSSSRRNTLKKKTTDLPTNTDIEEQNTEDVTDNYGLPNAEEDMKNMGNYVQDKYSKWQGIQQERETVASEIKDFEDAWSSGQYSGPEIRSAIENYVQELYNTGVPQEVIDEAVQYFQKRALELGIEIF